MENLGEYELKLIKRHSSKSDGGEDSEEEGDEEYQEKGVIKKSTFQTYFASITITFFSLLVALILL